MNNNGPLTEEVAVKYFTELILAVKHLHEDCKISHRDIKAENILLDSYGNIKLIDFGLSTKVDDDTYMKTQCGSLSYASPEIIIGDDYNLSCDFWSCGVVLYAIVVGKLPFDDPNMQRLAHKIVFEDVSYPTNLSPILIDLLKRLLTKDFHKRINVKDILFHPWVSQTFIDISKSLELVTVNEKLILDSLHECGFDRYQVKYDVNAGISNAGTIAYKIMKRKKQNDALVGLGEPGYRTKLRFNRSSSVKDEHLPPLQKYSNNTYYNQRSMPLKQTGEKRRKVRIPIIQIH